MAVDNCRQCSKPFQRTGSNSLCPNCNEIDCKRYREAYAKVGRYLNHLDYDLLALKLKSDKRRVQDGLLYRMDPGAVSHLSGHNRGFCYICSSRMLNKDSSEPVCLKCLDQIEKAVHELPLLAAKKEAGQGKLLTKPAPGAAVCACCGQTAVKVVCLSCHEKDGESLELAPPAMPEEDDSGEEPEGLQPEDELVAFVEASADFLDILAEDEAALPDSSEMTELVVADGAFVKDLQRHYDFKRYKQR